MLILIFFIRYHLNPKRMFEEDIRKQLVEKIVNALLLYNPQKQEEVDNFIKVQPKHQFNRGHAGGFSIASTFSILTVFASYTTSTTASYVISLCAIWITFLQEGPPVAFRAPVGHSPIITAISKTVFQCHKSIIWFFL